MAMQIAAMNPLAVDETSIPADVIEREKNIAIEVVKAEANQLNGRENSNGQTGINSLRIIHLLLATGFVKDANKSVADYLKSIDADLKVTEFKGLR